MKNSKKQKESKELALHYMGRLAEVARESFLILDADLRVILANPTFYRNFQISKKETENRLFYRLGNGQWNIPQFKKLLEEVLPKKKVVEDYEVEHVFETIGEKKMLLNASQIDTVQLIVLAIEDITGSVQLQKRLDEYTKGLEVKVEQRTAQLAAQIKELESLNKTMVGRELKMVELKKEIENLKKRASNDMSVTKMSDKNDFAKF